MQGVDAGPRWDRFETFIDLLDGHGCRSRLTRFAANMDIVLVNGLETFFSAHPRTHWLRAAPWPGRQCQRNPHSGSSPFRSASIFPAGIEPMHTIKKAQLDRPQDRASTAARSFTRSPLIIGRSPRFSESYAAIATEPFCAPTTSAFSLYASVHRRTTGQRAPRGHEHCHVADHLLRCGHPQRH